MTGGTLAFGNAHSVIYASWENRQTTPPFGLPWTFMTIDYKIKHDDKVDTFRLKYEWKFLIGYYPTEKFTVSWKLEDGGNWYELYSDTFQQTIWDGNGVTPSFYPRHSAELYLIRNPTNAYVYGSAKVFRHDYVSHDSWTKTQVWVANPSVYGSLYTSINSSTVFEVNVYCTRDGGSCPIKQRYWQYDEMRIVGDINNDHTVNILDSIILGQHYGEKFVGGIPTVEYFDWSAYYCDLVTDGKINILDSMQLSNRFNAHWD